MSAPFLLITMIKKILVLTPAWVGDAVMAQPLYRRLQQRHPEVVIDVLAPAWTAAIHGRMSEIRRVIENPFAHGQLRLRDRYRLGRKLAQEGYQQAIVLPNSLKSALIPWFAGIPCRTGWVGEMRYGLLNDARKLDKTALPSMLERFLALAEPPKTTVNKPLPFPILQAKPVSATVLARYGLGLEKTVVALCPGAEYGPAKRWPVAHFAAVAQQAVAAGHQVWIFGSPKDAEFGTAIRELAPLPAVVDLCGKTTLEEAIDLLACAKVAVCNDSGLMHIAAALGVPLVALYGSSSPEFTPPLTERASIMSLNLSCSPCFERVCPLKHTDCLQQLQPAQVYQQVEHWLLA